MGVSKISDEILEMTGSGLLRKRIRVIISLENNASLDDAVRDLEKSGLEIENAIPGPVPFVSGAILLEKISDIAALHKVKKVELDSEIHAL